MDQQVTLQMNVSFTQLIMQLNDDILQKTMLR